MRRPREMRPRGGEMGARGDGMRLRRAGMRPQHAGARTRRGETCARGGKLCAVRSNQVVVRHTLYLGQVPATALRRTYAIREGTCCHGPDATPIRVNPWLLRDDPAQSVCRTPGTGRWCSRTRYNRTYDNDRAECGSRPRCDVSKWPRRRLRRASRSPQRTKQVRSTRPRHARRYRR